jgi:hypothetical protein
MANSTMTLGSGVVLNTSVSNPSDAQSFVLQFAPSTAYLYVTVTGATQTIITQIGGTAGPVTVSVVPAT